MIRRLINTFNQRAQASIIRFRIIVYNSFRRRKQKKELFFKIKSAISSPKHTTFNSSQERNVELKDEDKKLSQVIVTCYFTRKPDPQNGQIRNSAEFSFIKPWYDSVMKIGVHGIVLHDGLEQSFIDQYSNDRIQFRFCHLGNYSIFEERWLLYHLFLSKLTNLKNVFFTDSNDVNITKNPFHLIQNSLAFYVGRDNANRVKDSGWLKAECDQFLIESQYDLPVTYNYQWVYNAGVAGGSRNVMFFVTNEMSKLIFQATSLEHKDMTLLNIVIHSHFFPKLSYRHWQQKLVDIANDQTAAHENLLTGYPLNSGFKDYDANSDAYFIHK